MPPAPTVARFHAAVLAALGTAVGFRGEAARMEGLALGLLREAGCRMLLIGELHNLLAATAQRQRELLNLMRFLGNELGIPLVCLGTRDAYLAVRSDDQLENRFHPLPLPPGRTMRSSAGCWRASRRCCPCASRPSSGRRRCASW